VQASSVSYSAASGLGDGSRFRFLKGRNEDVIA